MAPRGTISWSKYSCHAPSTSQTPSEPVSQGPLPNSTQKASSLSTTRLHRSHHLPARMWSPWPGSRGYSGRRGGGYRGPHDYAFPGRAGAMENHWAPSSYGLNDDDYEFQYGGGWSGRYGREWHDDAMNTYRWNNLFPDTSLPYHGGFR